MADANIHDRLTIEQVYSSETFDHDSRLNAEIKSDTLYGVKILSEPDSNGNFRIARASRHVAEQNPEGDVVFVCPHGFAGDDTLMQGADYGGPEERSEQPDQSHVRSAAYERFITRVIEAARSANFKPEIGFHESRLEGFHGG